MGQDLVEDHATSAAGAVSDLMRCDAAAQALLQAVPKAKLVPVEEPKPRERILGLHPGAFEMSEDFDAYLGDEFWGLKE